jgi:hypothetical protein
MTFEFWTAPQFSTITWVLNVSLLWTLHLDMPHSNFNGDITVKRGLSLSKFYLLKNMLWNRLFCKYYTICNITIQRILPTKPINEHGTQLPWKINDCLCDQKIYNLLRNINVHSDIHESLPLPAILSELNPVYTFWPISLTPI